MATEDHDFEEINHFNFKDFKISWSKKNNGAVGDFSTKNLDSLFEIFSNKLGVGKNANYLKNLFQKSYLENTNLSDATRFLVNELFGKFGVVIIDGNDKDLKKIFIPFLEKELTEQVSFNEVSKTSIALKKNYEIQVNPRDINLFYLSNNSRERIIKDGNLFKVNNTKISFSEKEILLELYSNPEKFSPNVIIRPLYQEVILPNICYIGGGGEIAYWLQLKSYFEYFKIPFPLLLLRNSVLIISKKQRKKISKLNISYENIFKNRTKLITSKIKEISKLRIDFSKEKEDLNTMFEKIEKIASLTDASFDGAVKAQSKKQIKGLEYLEKRLLKAEKKKYLNIVKRIENIYNDLFPNDNLEERHRNFSEYYLEYGDEFILRIFEEIEPIDTNFKILEM